MSDAIAANPAGASEWARPVLLRQARESAGLHIAALAAALKVPVRKLEALEAGHYHELPDMTFARALASSACRHLKIDPRPVLEQIPFGHAPILGDNASSINAPFRPAKELPSFVLSDWIKRPAVMLTGALVLAALGLLYMPDWRPMIDAVSGAVSGFASSRAGPSGEAGTDAPAVPQAPVVSLATDAPVSLTPSLSVGSDDAAQPSTSAGAAPPVVPVTGAETLLYITATGDSWVEVVDGAGASQVQRMLKTGEALSFSVSPPYSVVLGRADAVQVSVRGKPFDVMPYARNSVARFQVK